MIGLRTNPPLFSTKSTKTATATATNVTDTDIANVIVLHYTIIAHESSICDVTNYPILFQN
jgi:hypothetical protein